MPYSKSKSKTKYSDTQRGEVLAILDSNGGNLSQTSRQTNVPLTTIHDWKSGLIHDEVSEIRNEKKAELSEIFERAARTYLENSLDDSSVSRTGGKDSIIAAGVAVDKMLLLRNQPTSIVQTQQSQVEHIVKITRQVAQMNGDTVEETLSVVMDLIEPELVEDVKRVLLGDGK